MYSVKELDQVIRRLHEMRSGLLYDSSHARVSEANAFAEKCVAHSRNYLPIVVEMTASDVLNLAAIEAAILQLELVKTQKILEQTQS